MVVGYEGAMIRLAQAEDMEMVFRWRNSSEVMEQSTLQRQVPRKEHEEWYTKTILGVSRLLWIVEPNAGTVRVDRHDISKGVVSIYVLKEFQGQGKGTTSLISACRDAFAHWDDVMELQANIREDNLRSIATFSAVGFQRVHEMGQPDHVLMVKHRE